jgi:hypothetical protein
MTTASVDDDVRLFEALHRRRVSAVAPIVGTGVLRTVMSAAILLGRGELVGRRLFVVVARRCGAARSSARTR